MTTQTFGSRAQVWHGTAKKTTGGLRKSDLMKRKGRIVSRRAHKNGLKMWRRNKSMMAKPFRRSGRKTRRRHRR